MTSTKLSTVVGVFEERQQADRAVDELRRAGFRDDQIRVAHQASGRESGTAADGKAAKEHDPGFFEGVADFFKDLFGSKEETSHYEGEYRAGRTIVRVMSEGRNNEALVILQRHGGYNKDNPRMAATNSTAATHGQVCSTSGGKGEGGQTMQLREEELHARKQSVQTGEVRVRKEVVTENKTLEVPVQREEIVIERHPVAGRAASGSDIRPGEEIRIPVKEEQVHVTKDTVVKEEVKVGKRQVQGTERVGGTVRKEEVRVDRKGDVDVRDHDTTKQVPRK